MVCVCGGRRDGVSNKRCLLTIFIVLVLAYEVFEYSVHIQDQAPLYCSKSIRSMYFYPQLLSSILPQLSCFYG